MNYKAHMLFGFLLGAAVSHFLLRLPLPQSAAFALISSVCALLPDLDLRKSKASQFLLFAALFAISAAAYFIASAFSGGLPQFIALLFGLLLLYLLLDWLIRPRHRGIMHSIAFAALSSLAAYALFGQFFALAFTVGFISHLALDNSLKIR